MKHECSILKLIVLLSLTTASVISSTIEHKLPQNAILEQHRYPLTLISRSLDEIDVGSLEWDDEITQPDEEPANESKSLEKFDDKIEKKMEDEIESENANQTFNVDAQRPPKSTWYSIGDGASKDDGLVHDTILYDVTMGFLFAAGFTIGVVIIGCCVSRCLTWMFCPDQLKKKRWRMRYRVEQMGVGGIFLPMRTFDTYTPINTQEEDDEEEEDSDEDPDRLEYGVVDKENDDDDDYSFGAKKDVRYEQDGIEKAAVDYFTKEEEVQALEQAMMKDDDSDEEKEDAQNDFLHLQEMEKKIAD
eukprot:CAMPEP_0172499092 /NCGR_PEP_ID=MMETSP1066-20121228/121897_1 /TAXON_ID=671091 /ORGANISM="Coscinodiscus wailesii, Strain CCMP2513" /LENGTH=302 /DNA_ID=CAMNT_0013272649 /DNA_START=74 /DNA_END=979 /DNA_ORIENTATION=+